MFSKVEKCTEFEYLVDSSIFFSSLLAWRWKNSFLFIGHFGFWGKVDTFLREKNYTELNFGSFWSEMARHYKRKTAPVDPQKMEKALSAVKNGTKLATAARQCGVHRTTLRRHVKLPPKKQSNQVSFDGWFYILLTFLYRSSDLFVFLFGLRRFLHMHRKQNWRNICGNLTIWTTA